MIPVGTIESQKSVSKITKIKKSWLIFSGLFLLGLIITLLSTGPISEQIEYLISVVENQYTQWFNQQNSANPIILFSLAFLGGLIASISPCILALLPINLSYIGTREIKSRKDAFLKASLFVFGVIIILSLFGLASSFAGAVMVEYRGYINLIVGIIILIMGLSLLGIINLPLPQINVNGSGFGPFGVGLTYGLVSSPCASPVLFAVLAAAGATGSQILAILTMVSYALGYTIIIFLASLITGLVRQTRLLLNHSELIIKIGSIALILAGGYYIFIGGLWFL
jgi:cytochrome c-type biogenesis protein